MKKIIIFLSLITISNNKSIEYCDIKGNINNPGVYEINNNSTIQDIIVSAGGLKRDSYTKNINLSKKVTDEMVIYINTKDEIERLKNLNNCDCSPNYIYIECDELNDTNSSILDVNNRIITNKLEEATKIKIVDNNISTTTETDDTSTTKVAINETATSKIIDNRIININTCTLDDLINIKGLGEKKAIKIIEYRESVGKFNTIEEIMNVSGIGMSIFDAIKDFIEV